MATRLTPFAKLLIVALIVTGLGFGVKYFLGSDAGKKLVEKTGQTTTTDNGSSNTSATSTGNAEINNKPTSFSDDPDVIKVQVFTFGGYAGGWYFNEGFEPSENSRFYKEYGLKVKFVLIDDFDGSRNAFKADEVQLFGNETSAMAAEMDGLGPYEPQVCFQVDWSRGADAIVVRKGIGSMNDLKGKKVAVTPATPSQTFLIWALEAANMKLTDIQILEVPSAIDAATAFKSGKVDAALVWSPDDEICVKEVAGSKILQSTRQASNIIADVMMAKKSWCLNNRDKLRKLYEGWMKGNAEISCNEANKTKAAKILGDAAKLSTEDAVGMINTLRLTTHGDNTNFFGLNPQYKGVTGEAIYAKMGGQYEKMRLAPKNRPTWKQLTATNVVGATNLSSECDKAEGAKEFAPATAKDETAPSIATKRISISFPTAQFELDANSKALIDLQFADIAKSYANARIRIEGNTDNVGKRESNMTLSKKRAESVARYLASQYGMNRNRFVLLGNGPDKPVDGCEDNQDADCKAKNRRTEFQIIGE